MEIEFGDSKKNVVWGKKFLVSKRKLFYGIKD